MMSSLAIGNGETLVTGTSAMFYAPNGRRTKTRTVVNERIGTTALRPSTDQGDTTRSERV